MIHANLDSARLDGAKLNGADLTNAVVARTSLTNPFRMSNKTILTQQQLDKACGTDAKLPPGLLTPQTPAPFPAARCAAQIARPAKPKTSFNQPAAPWSRFPEPQPPRLTVAEQIAFCLSG
jgi:hypothetical protein